MPLVTSFDLFYALGDLLGDLLGDFLTVLG